ncbi:MAG: rane protein of unknown function [Blastococcus sp.]|jgi:uncharacterized BrkB/YihY/UPF0761 family membrane protein|nr:rane protein of unknown function [Blastococcus sp.]
MPTSVRIAVIAMGVLVALLLSNAALSWYVFDAVVDGVLEANPEVDRGLAERTISQNIAVYSVVGLLMALSAWFLPRRQPWARWVGLAATVATALLTLFSIVVTGGASAYSLLQLVLAIAAVTSLLARTTGAWVPRLRARA